MSVQADEIEAPVIYVVDDDPSVRDSLEDLLSALGMRPRLFASAQEFIGSIIPDTPGCIVLDVRMPGMSGIEFQEWLATSGIRLPIIFITSHGDIPMSVRAMKAGAIEFLTKPFREQDLLDAIHEAVRRDTTRWRTERQTGQLIQRYDSLSEREKQIMALVVSGLLNKQIAGKLNISEITVKVRRGHVMHKMQARSLADLVRISEQLKQAGAQP